MNVEQKNQIVEHLVAFVERASGKNATPEEVKVLPEVASLVLKYCPKN